MKIASVPWRCGHSWAKRGSGGAEVWHVRQDRGGVEDLDAGRVGQHGVDNVAGFRWAWRAGHIGHHATGAAGGEGRSEQRALELGEGGQV